MQCLKEDNPPNFIFVALVLYSELFKPLQTLQHYFLYRQYSNTQHIFHMPIFISTATDPDIITLPYERRNLLVNKLFKPK